jgi:hypothetical protein
MKLRKLACGVAAGVLAMASAPSEAATYLLKFYQVDDDMSAYITNSDYSQQLLFSKGFGADYDYVDISSYVRDGINALTLTLNNGPAGWTYGYDFKIDGVSYASGSCGVFNTHGCNADSYDQGLVWSTNVRFKGSSPVSVPGGGTGAGAGAVPEPASWAMMISGFGMIGCLTRKRRRGNRAVPVTA